MLNECLVPNWGISIAKSAQSSASSDTPKTSLPNTKAIFSSDVG